MAAIDLGPLVPMSVLQSLNRMWLSLLLAAVLSVPQAAADDPLGAPQNASGEDQADGSFLLSWNPPASGEADGYRVYENGDLMAEVEGLTYTVTSTLPASVYTVTAFNAWGESHHSHPVLDTPMKDDPSCHTFPVWIEPGACKKAVINLLRDILCPGSPCPLADVLNDGPTVMD